MRIQPTEQNNPTFRYSSPLKTLWKAGKLPTVKRGIYGGILTKKTCTIEHLQAHSKGGANALENYAVATKENNHIRGDKPLKDFLTWDMANEYLKQFIDVIVGKFDGNKYIEMIRKTLTKLIGKERG